MSSGLLVKVVMIGEFEHGPTSDDYQEIAAEITLHGGRLVRIEEEGYLHFDVDENGRVSERG